MSKIYLAINNAPDELLGYVKDDGKIYRSKPGFDEHIGHVDLGSGKVYTERFGPDKVIGRVDLKSGKVYQSRLGPDEYVGNVDREGRMHRHESMAADDYIGRTEQFISLAHSGGGLLLLVLPALEQSTNNEAQAGK
jgi:hypothetical protein